MRSAVFRDFKSVSTFRSLFRRKTHKIYDANLHHGDIRPFACPVELCCNASDAQELYPLRECECLSFNNLSDAVGGFCSNHHFYIENNRLRESSTDQICKKDSCLAGLPIPTDPIAEASCTECDDKTPPVRKPLHDTTNSTKCGINEGKAYSSGTETTFDCDTVELNENTSIYESSCDGGACDAVEVFYRVTWVKRTPSGDIESAPSGISNGVVTDGYIPNALVSWSSPPDDWCIDRVRLYRSESVFEDGTTESPYEGSEWILVKEFEHTVTSFTDNIETSCTGYPLITNEPSLFPAPENINHVTRTEDGVVVADESNIYISQSGVALFSWDGIISIEDNIRAIESIGNTIFVLTDNYPVKIKYTVSDGILSVNRQTIRRRLPLKSEKSVSSYGNTVYFASEYSLIAWDIAGYGSDIKDALRILISPEQWSNIKPETVRGTAYEYGYIMSSDAMPYALMLEFEGDGIDTINKTSVMPITYAKADAYATDKDGHIIFKNGDCIYRWDWRRDICDNTFDLQENNHTDYCEDCCPWKVELYYDNEGKNRFDVMRVEFDEQSTLDGIDAEFFRRHFNRSKESDGKFKITSSVGFRIHGYRSSQTVSVELSSCGIMHEVRFATSFQELVSTGGDSNEHI